MAKDNNTATSTELAMVSPRTLGIIEQLGITLSDPADVQWRIAEVIATANTLEDLLADQGPEGLREHLGEPFLIRSVEYLPSRFPGSPLFAVISAVTENGEPVTYTTGALSVVIQVARGVQMGWWQDEFVKAVWATDEPSPEGNRPYKLVKA